MAGYLNETINNINGINTRLEQEGMINILKYKHIFNLPQTHMRGYQAIDHIWTTEHLPCA